MTNMLKDRNFFMKFEIREITFNREEKEKILKEIAKQHIELSEIKDEE